MTFGERLIDDFAIGRCTALRDSCHGKSTFLRVCVCANYSLREPSACKPKSMMHAPSPRHERLLNLQFTGAPGLADKCLKLIWCIGLLHAVRRGNMLLIASVISTEWFEVLLVRWMYRSIIFEFAFGVTRMAKSTWGNFL